MSDGRTRGLRDFGIRTLSAALLGGVVLAVLFFGGTWGLAAAVAVIAALAATELYALARRERRLPNEMFGITAVVAMPLVAARWGGSGLAAVISALIVASLVWHVLFRQVRLSDTAVTVFGAAYVGFTLSHVVLIRQLDGGTMLTLTMILGIWANDVAAYLVGSTVGKRPLAARISPRKTWEGLAGGTAGTVAVWLLVGPLAETGLSVSTLLLIGLVSSLAAVFGDLAESRFKREASVKDSGTLLPGHGGFLDRFDSFIVVSIVTYYLLVMAGVQ
jgi:phosphatidate cytidylyltransferase